MFRQGLLFCFLFIHTNFAFSYVKADLKKYELSNIYSKYSKSDLIAAEKILKFYRNIGKRKSNFSSADLKLITQSTLFSNYRITLTRLLKSNYCDQNETWEQQELDQVLDLIITKARKNCFDQLRDSLSKSASLKRKHFDFIKSHYKIFFSNPYDESLKDLFKNKNEYTNDLLKFIRQKYLDREIEPSPHLLSVLELDADLTKLLQEINYYSNLDKKYLGKELNKLFGMVKTNIKNESTEEAKYYLKELVDFHHKNELLLGEYNFDKKLHYIARLTLKNPDLDLQKVVYNFSKKLQEEDSFNETIFQILYNYINQEEPYLATKFIADKKLLSQLENLSSKNRYWIGRSLELNREITEAKEVYIKQIELVPFSFYSIISLERLKILNPSYTSKFLVKQSYIDKEILPTATGINELRKLNIWLKTGAFKFFNAQKEEYLNRCSTSFIKTTDSSYQNLSCQQVLIRMFSMHGQYIESFKLAYQFLQSGKIEFDETLVETLFPVKYLGEIEKTGITEKIILALMRQESGFNPYARSPAGAIGLMQLMPATARSFHRGITKRKLHNPSINIKIGGRYLKYLLKKYDGNLTFVFAAYNAGEGNLRRWIREGVFKGTALENIEQIPFHETRMYVKLLYRNMYFYNMLTQQRNVSSINSEDSLLNYKLKH